ncbi:hypothetical protein JL721_6092 [Aureococcus anophagefferens]|nr:hypothetical protein JL721_6092 [Aureococcus anophagefferens]
MMPLSRRLLITSALFMFLTALTGAVFRWIGAARDLRAKKLDVAPPFERVGEGPPTRTPLATGAWWTNLHLDEGEQAVPGPYAVRGSGSALEVCYGAKHRSNTATVVVDAFVADVTVTAAGNGTRCVVRADELTATYAFGRGARALFARGSPYVTVELDRGADVELGSAGVSSVVALRRWRRAGGHGRRGRRARARPTRAAAASRATAAPRRRASSSSAAAAGGGASRKRQRAELRRCARRRRWLLFVGRVLAKAGASWRLRAPTDVVARLAYAPDRASEELLVAHAGTYAVGGKVSWAARGDAAVLRFRWATRTFDGAPLLGLALPHHAETLSGSYKKTSWAGLKGPLVAVAGPTWTFKERLADLRWDHGPLPRSAKSDILAALKTVADVAPDGLDERDLAERTGVYTSGKRLFRLANRGLLVYDGDVGGVVTRSSYKDPEADFGNGKYNDHHFHYGYLVYAAAVAAHLGETVDRAAVDALVSDVANVAGRERWFAAATDPNFYAPRSSRVAAFARHKDAYDGHSWASGLFSLADGKSQESVSEALHCYYAVGLWGVVRKDPELRDFGRLLLALEARAGRAYWHVDEANVYGGAFAAANVVVGVVGAADASACDASPDSPAACAAHAGCAALTGDCCPTAAGVALGCCDDRR